MVIIVILPYFYMVTVFWETRSTEQTVVYSLSTTSFLRKLGGRYHYALCYQASNMFLVFTAVSDVCCRGGWQTGREDEDMVDVWWWREWIGAPCIFWVTKSKWILLLYSGENLDKCDGNSSFSGHQKLIIAYCKQNACPKEKYFYILCLLRGGGACEALGQELWHSKGLGESCSSSG